MKNKTTQKMLLQLRSRIHKLENEHFTMQKVMHMKASVRFPPSFPCLLNSCVMRYISASFLLPSLRLSPLLPSNRSTQESAVSSFWQRNSVRPDTQRGAPAILTPAHITRAPEGCANTSAKHFGVRCRLPSKLVCAHRWRVGKE